jgi:hypothetical protein
MNLKKLILLFLLFNGILFSQNFLDKNSGQAQKELRIYYNLLPDTLIVNGEMISVEGSGQKVMVDVPVNIHAVRAGYYPVDLQVTELKSYGINVSEITFKKIVVEKEEVDPYRPETLLSEEGKYIAVASLFYKNFSVSPINHYFMSGVSAAAITTSNYFQLHNSGFPASAKNILFGSVATQSLIWFGSQFLGSNPQRGIYIPDNNNSIYIAFGVTYRPLYFSSADKSDRIVTDNGTFSYSYNFKNLQSYPYFIDIEKYLTKNVFVSLITSFNPFISPELTYSETLVPSQYYPPEEPVILEKTIKIKKPFYSFALDFNYNFLRIANQEWGISLGAYYQNPVEIDYQFNFPDTSFIAVYGQQPYAYRLEVALPGHQTKVNQKYQSYGLSPGFVIHYNLTDHFSFALKQKFFILIQSENVNLVSKSYYTWWQVGLRYHL